MKTAPQSKLRRIAITTGDQDGIGPEVTYKALSALGHQRNVVFVIFRSAQLPDQLARKIRRSFAKVQECRWAGRDLVSLKKTLAALEPMKSGCLEVIGSQSPARWVEVAAQGAAEGFFHSLVTGPLSKTTIRESGLKDLGHTQILQRVTRSKRAFMGFVGDSFSVVLGAGHIQLTQAPSSFLAHFESAVEAALELRALLPKTKRQLPIGVVGIDPHCGEEGLIGHIDLSLKRKLTKLKKKGLPLEGPLVPDTAFQKSNWKKYSVFLASNHDQGLIPFKLVHGFDAGVHLTLGIPLLRTSVDHGTAKDLFGRHRAQFGSMKAAIQASLMLGR